MSLRSVVTNFIANIPIMLANVLVVFIGLLSFIGQILLAVGMETHKYLQTDTGKKLIELDKTVKKVTDYIDKTTKAAAAAQQPGAKPAGEGARLLNVVKGTGGGNNEST